MVRTRFALIFTSAWWPLRLHAILCQRLFEIHEDMVQILLILAILFTQDSKIEDLFCGASSSSEPRLCFSNYIFSLGFKPIQDDFQHDFARMTDDADSSSRAASCPF